MTGIPCFPLGLVTDARSGLGASVDAITYDGRLVEIKCPYKRYPKRGVVPITYDAQMQQQAFVMQQVSGIKQAFIFFVEYRPKVLGGEPLLSVQLVPQDANWYEKNEALIVPFVKALRSEISK